MDNKNNRFQNIAEQLAIEIDKFAEDFDPYEYADSVSSSEENINEIKNTLLNGASATNGVIEWLRDAAEEEGPERYKAKELLSRVEMFTSRTSIKKNGETKNNPKKPKR